MLVLKHIQEALDYTPDEIVDAVVGRRVSGTPDVVTKLAATLLEALDKERKPLRIEFPQLLKGTTMLWNFDAGNTNVHEFMEVTMSDTVKSIINDIHNTGSIQIRTDIQAVDKQVKLIKKIVRDLNRAGVLSFWGRDEQRKEFNDAYKNFTNDYRMASAWIKTVGRAMGKQKPVPRGTGEIEPDDTNVYFSAMDFVASAIETTEFTLATQRSKLGSKEEAMVRSLHRAANSLEYDKLLTVYEFVRHVYFDEDASVRFFETAGKVSDEERLLLLYKSGPRGTKAGQFSSRLIGLSRAFDNVLDDINAKNKAYSKQVVNAAMKMNEVLDLGVNPGLIWGCEVRIVKKGLHEDFKKNAFITYRIGKERIGFTVRDVMRKPRSIG